MEIKIDLGSPLSGLIEFFLTQAGTMFQMIKEVQDKMATKEELSAAVDNIKAAVTKLGSDLSVHIADLRAQIAAGADVSAELAKIQEIANSLEAIDATIPEQTPPTPTV